MLATDPSLLQDRYDVIIIGSGYGGAITAARLGYANAQAGKKLKIAIFERGVEHPTGSFPATAGQFAGAIKTKDNPLGLFDFVPSPNFFVVQGSGLGGTSLCNGSVCIIPDREAFKYWPTAIQNEDPPLGKYYQRALQMLGAVRYAEGEGLPKVPVMEEISKAVGGEFNLLNLAVTKKSRVTKFGIPRKACVNCTSCISGCNYEAKNTLDKNYLPMAKHYGVDMFVRMEVDFLQELPDDKGYLLSVKSLGGNDGTEVTNMNITCKNLVLSAGCLGTTGIMLRSRSRGMKFSRHLSKRFSGNGDYFALAYNMNKITNMNGWGVGTPAEFQVNGGPTITTVFRVNRHKPLEKRLTFEEASMPSPFVETMRNITFAAAGGQPWSLLNNSSKVKRWLQDRYRNNTGALNSSLLYLGMGFDGAEGTIKLRNDGAAFVDWPNAVDAEVFKLLEPVTIKGTAAIGGNQLPNPTLKFGVNPLNVPLDRVAITGHPIGGCATANDVDGGVVDDRGRVFHPDGHHYKGLYIFDGSVFPNAIGVNVLLTVSAFTERAVEFMRQDLNLPDFNIVDEGDDLVRAS